jgi:VWFA-related protein
MTRTVAGLVAACLVAAHPGIRAGQSATPATQASPQRPRFRAGVDLVPLDVSVIDRKGRPVTDLTQADFEIFEDGVRQDIKSFAATALAPEPPSPDASPVLIRQAPSTQPAAQTPTDRLAAQHRRTFLIVLGYGRIDLPTKAFDATMQFIRERLLPQDLVAVLAWNRVTDLTTDHEQVAQVVERYRKENDAVREEIAEWMRMRRYPDDDLPPSIQAHIDRVFEPPAGATTPARPVHMRSATELLLGTAEYKRQDRSKAAVPWNVYVAVEGPRVDNYLSKPPHLYLERQLPKVYAGIEYLRHVDGEKHLVVLLNGPNVKCASGGLVSAGFAGCDSQEDLAFAARAGDARVVVDIIHTDGVPAYGGAPRSLGANAQISAPTFFWGASSAEQVAQLTGGEFLGTHYASETFAKVDAATRFGYLLGYTPINAALDDRVRKIVVKVSRPDVTVFYRHGYHAQEEPTPLDLEAAIRDARRAGAARYDREAHDIKVVANVSRVPGLIRGQQWQVDLTIDLSRVALPIVDGRHAGGLDVTIYCGDAKEQVVGQVQQTIDLKLTDETFAAAQRDGLKRSFRIPVSADPKYIKAIVYDFGADLTGTVMVTIR